MRLNQYTSDMQTLLNSAGALLGGSARSLQVEWTMEQRLEQRLQRRQRAGLVDEPPLVRVEETRRGHELSVGIQLYVLPTSGGDIPVAEVVPPRSSGIYPFWAVQERDVRRFYRELRSDWRRFRREFNEPLMSEGDRKRLWNNTIEFLRREQTALRKFGIPQKRGVLLTGTPGNGKTMACRWLSVQCERFGLEWKTVHYADYQRALREGDLHDLFQPSCRGIVQFDDFDSAIQDRKKLQSTQDQATFLAELDGMSPKHGVVYLFTSNLKPDELDSAIRRPGRIDEFIHFSCPGESLRRRLIKERWHSDLVAEIDIDGVVGATEGLSFAEIDEVKKQLALAFLDRGVVDWPQICASVVSRGTNSDRLPIGFRAATDDSFHETTVAKQRIKTI